MRKCHVYRDKNWMIEFKINWRKSTKKIIYWWVILGSFDRLDFLSSCLLIHSVHSLENILVIVHACVESQIWE